MVYKQFKLEDGRTVTFDFLREEGSIWGMGKTKGGVKMLNGTYTDNTIMTLSLNEDSLLK